MDRAHTRFRGPKAIFVALLCGAVFFVYWPSLAGLFIYDDASAIERNKSIRSLSLWSLGDVLIPPESTPVGGRPLVNLSFALNYAAGELSPRGYRIVNIALHALSALAVWGVLRRTFLRAEVAERFGRAAEPLAMTITAIWALHPLTVDAVAYVTQRSELLVSLFYLLTLYGAIRGWDASAPTRRAGWFAVAVAACAAGMASKEIMVSAPLAVWLYDRAFVSGGFRRALRRSWWLYSALACTWAMLAALVWSAPRADSAGFHLGVSWWHYLLTQAPVIVTYLKLCFWPWPLSIAYPLDVVRRPAEVSLEAALVLSLLALTAWALVRRPRSAVPAACFFMILAPTSSFIPIIFEVAAEKRMYLPLAAVGSLLGPGVYLLLRRLSVPRAALVTLTAALVLTLASRTFLQARIYGDPIATWKQATETFPRLDVAWNNYGQAFSLKGRIVEGIPHFRRALELNPRNWVACTNLGRAYRVQGELDVAIEHFSRAVRMQPMYDTAWRLLAQTYVEAGQSERAVPAYVEALQFRSDWIDGLNELAWIRATHPDAALRNAEHALSLATRACELEEYSNPMTMDTLSAARAEGGDFASAIRTAEQALVLARQRGPAELIPQLEQRLAGYRKNQPYRDAALVRAATTEPAP